MTSPDTLPAAIGLPIALAATLGWLWPSIREWLTPHRWQGIRRHDGTSSRWCVTDSHTRCRGVQRDYNRHGVRLCTAHATVVLPVTLRPVPVVCDLHYGHHPRDQHFNIDTNRTFA